MIFFSEIIGFCVMVTLLVTLFSTVGREAKSHGDKNVSPFQM